MASFRQAQSESTDGREGLWLLGASNLARSRGLAVAVAAARFPGVDLRVDAGHGRSLLGASTYLGRRLPVSGRPFGDVAPRQVGPAVVPSRCLGLVLADIGVDLVYGASVGELLGAVAGLRERLGPQAAVAVLPPVEILGGLSPAVFSAFRRLFFPGRAVERRRLLADLEELRDGLLGLEGVDGVNPRSDWYGMDPIHWRARRFGPVWSEILDRLETGLDIAGARAARVHGPAEIRRRPFTRSRLPAGWRLLGVPLGSRQPCATLPGGGRLWLG